jgi:hypothetical protein
MPVYLDNLLCGRAVVTVQLLHHFFFFLGAVETIVGFPPTPCGLARLRDTALFF